MTPNIQHLGIWQSCDCDDYWCRLHEEHAFECGCPVIENFLAIGLSPYGEPAMPHPTRAGAKHVQHGTGENP